jgi:uncharacterized protein DUF3501
MPIITRDSLMSLEIYARQRQEFRKKVMAHKKNRTVRLGEHVMLLFEDELTIRYQVQEMLRIEKIFEPEDIEEELGAYNPLIPDGHNWKASMLIEYEDPAVRARMLAKLKGIENKTWIQVAGCPKVYPIADEDLPRETEQKTSSVHFLRFELSPAMITGLKAGALLTMGVEHPEYRTPAIEVAPAIRQALISDLK